MTNVSTIPGFRALILEDHEFQRLVAAQVLEHCGAVEVLEATDGITALEMVHNTEQPLDILLCDLNMPGMDGLQFLRHIAERRNTSSVILASALDPSILRAAEIMAQSYGIRIIGVVEKPLSRAKLMPLILRHFGQARISRQPTELIPLAEIEHGLERGEFLPFFQPKVSMRNCALVGVEVLMRWRHHDRGWIKPDAFIPVMESHGLITPATYRLLDMALIQCKYWQEVGVDVPIALNISVESLSDVRLADRLEMMVLKSGLPTSALTLEVTETVAMTDLGHSLETLARCRMKGFDLSIDDYGTGFSSMQQLTRLPVGELKIDQSFVSGACNEPILEALVETSITMAKRLNLKTTAEGVETSDDWDLVARLGCDIAQGYFVARPMPAEELLNWYSNWLGTRGDGKF
ncbi:MAG TPA: EAL domain-containing response regulator [Stellaceae bacterium]|nr:EAL domain-containing response regulator [Stellaceae bacterium]